MWNARSPWQVVEYKNSTHTVRGARRSSIYLSIRFEWDRNVCIFVYLHGSTFHVSPAPVRHARRMSRYRQRLWHTVNEWKDDYDLSTGNTAAACTKWLNLSSIRHSTTCPTYGYAHEKDFFSATLVTALVFFLTRESRIWTNERECRHRNMAFLCTFESFANVGLIWTENSYTIEY